MKNIKVFLFLLSLVFFSVKSKAGDIKAAPSPVELYRASLNQPTAPFEGHMMITQWSGSNVLIEEANIYFKPPNYYRLEFLMPDGSLDRVIITDGSREQVQLIQPGGVKKEFNTISLPRAMTEQQQKDLLLINYKVNLLGSESVLGRPVWILELAPVISGKPFQQVRVDEGTHVCLETKRLTAEGSNISVTRFTRFDLKKSISDSLFLQPESSDGLLLKENDRTVQTGDSISIPTNDYQQNLPGGFSILNADNFEYKGNTVRYFRYTDGLVPISMFETPFGINMPATALEPSPQSYVWNNGHNYFTLIGDVDLNLLKEISTAILK